MEVAILILSFIGQPLEFQVSAYDTMADCLEVSGIINENLNPNKAYAYCEKGK